uniref:Uncharacterized protein LOC105035383 n=1 Tax=Elaeis guineensis var. tenera TaxID=51953 RepID=A0A6I9QJ55_ELAGV|nr:uncharacterized protein LOC105035383 [Elaeis guineensis]
MPIQEIFRPISASPALSLPRTLSLFHLSKNLSADTDFIKSRKISVSSRWATLMWLMLRLLLMLLFEFLNNQLSSLMWIDEKANEFSTWIQRLANWTVSGFWLN